MKNHNNVIHTSSKCVLNGIKDNRTIVRVIVWRWTVDKRLLEPVLIKKIYVKQTIEFQRKIGRLDWLGASNI